MESNATTRPTRLARRRDRRKSEICRVAIRQLAANGYLAVSLEQVADAADIAKATLYHYFASKDELVAEALEALTAEVMERLHAVLASVEDQSRRAQFRALAHEQLEILTGDYPEVGTIFSAQGWWPEVHDQARKSMRREHDAIFRGVLEAGIAAGEFHCEDVDVALQCHHAIMNTVSAWLGRIEDPVAAQRARGAVVNAVMRVVDAADDDSPPQDSAR